MCQHYSIQFGIILETYLVFRVRKEFLAKAVAMLLVPLFGQELLNLVSSLKKLVAVAPDGIGGVCHLDSGRIP